MGSPGCALAAGGAVLVSASFRGVDRIADTIVAQRNALTLSLATVADAIENAASSTDSVDRVLGDAGDAVGDAATMVRSLATAADDVANAATFQILGSSRWRTSRPRSSAWPRTREASPISWTRRRRRSRGRRVSTGRLHEELDRVAGQVRTFSESLASASALDDLEEGFNAPKIVLYGLLGVARRPGVRGRDRGRRPDRRQPAPES